MSSVRGPLGCRETGLVGLGGLASETAVAITRTRALSPRAGDRRRHRRAAPRRIQESVHAWMGRIARPLLPARRRNSTWQQREEDSTWPAGRRNSAVSPPSMSAGASQTAAPHHGRARSSRPGRASRPARPSAAAACRPANNRRAMIRATRPLRCPPRDSRGSPGYVVTRVTEGGACVVVQATHPCTLRAPNRKAPTSMIQQAALPSIERLFG
jgi:hypothetical protein